MMGVAIDPAFTTNRRIYTCFLSNKGGPSTSGSSAGG